MIETAEWVLIGVLIGSPIGFIISSVLTSDKMEDLDTEVQDLRTQRQLLKEEVFRLTKRGKPAPRKRNWKRKPRKK